MTVTATRRTRGPGGTTRNKPVPQCWQKILRAIPGYDPFRDAAGCQFDAARAQRYIDFIETCCTHTEGELAGSPFLLELWEKAIVANLIGWLRRDDRGRTVRRYREALIYVGRKNGKTPLVAALANAIFFCDKEFGQKNYCTAGDVEQAAILFDHMAGMVRNEPEMDKRVTIYRTTRAMEYPARRSYMKVLAADKYKKGETKHGRNPHLIVVDELHAQYQRDLVDALSSSMVSLNRPNALIVFITTADFDRPSVCNEKYDYACKVRDGLPDARFLPVIYEAARDDDWTDEDVWRKANPNLGVSVSLEDLRCAFQRAREEVGYENTFRRLHLNQRTEQAERVMPMEAWDACRREIDWNKLAGQPCWGGFDVGATRDFVALALLFPQDDGEAVTIEYEDLRDQKQTAKFMRHSYSLRTWFWLPERPVKRNARMENDIATWTRQRYILRTPGEVVDYDQVAADVGRLLAPYGLVKLAIDQGFQGMAITQTLQKVFGEERIIAVRQGILTMAAPFRELLELIIAGRLHHDGDPVLRWMASNVAAERRGGLIKPSKDHSPEKIDGITAATMALAVAMTEEPPQQSVYEERGIVTLGGEGE